MHVAEQARKLALMRGEDNVSVGSLYLFQKQPLRRFGKTLVSARRHQAAFRRQCRVDEIACTLADAAPGPITTELSRLSPSIGQFDWRTARTMTPAPAAAGHGHQPVWPRSGAARQARACGSQFA